MDYSRSTHEAYSLSDAAPDGVGAGGPNRPSYAQLRSTRMFRRMQNGWFVAPLLATLVIVVGVALTLPDPDQRHRPPAGEVRIERIVDFQLPEL